MAVTIQKCQLADDFDRGCHYKMGVAAHQLKYLVETAETNLCGAEVLREAIFGSLPVGSDPVPDFGDKYAFNVFEESAYAVDFDCVLEDPKQRKVWTLTVKFEAPSREGGKRDREEKTKPNPLDWDPVYYVDYVEEQVPVEIAILQSGGKMYFEDPSADLSPEQLTVLQRIGERLWYLPVQEYFPFIKRGRQFHPITGELLIDYEPGPIVNTAGQQTIDPVMELTHHPKLVAFRNYATAFEAIEMNRRFRGCVNDSDFLGDPPRTWRYILSYTEKPNEKEASTGSFTDTDFETPEIITYYPTYTILEYNEKTWDRFILNNGQSCFRKATAEPIDDPRFPGQDVPLLFPARVMELKEGVEETLEEEGFIVDLEDLEPVSASEPVNLDLSGFAVHETVAAGATPGEAHQVYHLQYSHYNEIDFNDIPAFAELIAEYEQWLLTP